MATSRMKSVTQFLDTLNALAWTGPSVLFAILGHFPYIWIYTSQC